MSVPYEKIVEEDLNLGSDEVEVTMPAGGTATGHQIGPHTFAARAYAAELASSQTVGSGVTTLELDTEDLDTDDWYDPVTFEFQPTVAGIYQITGQITFGPLTGVATAYLYRGASEIARVDTVRSAAGGTIQVTALVTMDGDDDVVTLRFSHTDDDDIDVTAANVGGILINKLDV